MFSISIKLAKSESLSAIRALDFRRKFGLADGTQLSFTAAIDNGRNVILQAPVSEGFARAWFDGGVTSLAEVPVAFLQPGELELVKWVIGQGNVADPEGDTASLVTTLSPERIVELYIAVRFAACRAQVSRLSEKVEELKAKLPSEDADDDED